MNREPSGSDAREAQGAGMAGDACRTPADEPVAAGRNTGGQHSGTACPQSRSGSRDAVAATAARQRSAIVVPSEAAKRRTAAASARG